MKKINEKTVRLNREEMKKVNGGNTRFVPTCIDGSEPPVWDCGTCRYSRMCKNMY